MCRKCTKYISPNKSIDRMVNGVYHCETKPAIVGYYISGNIKTESWWYNGELHRDDDLPACTEYSCGGIIYRSWIKHDKYHRECGPARVWYDIDGNVQKQIYYNEGVEYEPITKSALKT